MDLPNENLSEESFVELSTLRPLRMGLGAARTHPRIWLGAFGYLVGVEAGIGFLGGWFDIGPAEVMLRVAVLFGVIGYLVPSVWAYRLEQPLSRQDMKHFTQTQIGSLTNLGLAIGLITALSGVGLGVGFVGLSEAWENGNAIFAITAGVLVSVILIRIALAVFILTPVGLVEQLRAVDAFERAWKVSGRAKGMLSLLVFVGALIQLTGGFGMAAIIGTGEVSDWTFTVVIAPVASSILNLWWILSAGPAYAFARQTTEGYTMQEAHQDFRQLLAVPDAEE